MRRTGSIQVGPAPGPRRPDQLRRRARLGADDAGRLGGRRSGIGSAPPAPTFGLEPIGYRALDALRMEKGYRYFGTDLTMLDTPFEAGLGAFVRLGKGPFIGRDALVAAQATRIGPAPPDPRHRRRRLRARLRRRSRPRSTARSSAACAASPTARPSSARSATPTSRIDAAKAPGSRSTSSIGASARSYGPDVLVDPAGDRMRG